MKPGIRYRVFQAVQSPWSRRTRARFQRFSLVGQPQWFLPVGIASLVALVVLIPAAFSAGESAKTAASGKERGLLPMAATAELSITSTRPTASEAGQSVALVTLDLGGPSDRDLTINLEILGTAQNGVDYQPVETLIQIPAGQASETITVIPIDDADIEEQETINISLTTGSGYIVGAPNRASVVIEDDDLPLVTVAASSQTITEEGASQGGFTVSRTGPVTDELQVSFAIRGSATPASDFVAIPSEAVIPAGQSSALVALTPIDDDEIEEDENVTLILIGSHGYSLQDNVQAAITVVDDDLPTVNVVVSGVMNSEGGPPGLLTVSRDGPITAPLIVTYSVGGTASANADYQNLSGTVTIPAGQVAETIRVVPIDDSVISESAETVTVTLTANPEYLVGGRSTATVTITDNDLPVVTVEASDSAALETGPDQAVFTVRRTGGTTSELAIAYTLGGTAGNGVDYLGLTGSVVIPAGQTAATVVIVPIDDRLFEPDETVTLVLSSSTRYTTGDAAQATAVIASSDLPKVTVTKEGDANEEESTPGVVVFTRSGDLSYDLVITYTADGTATNGVDYVGVSGVVIIPAGASSATVIVTPIDDEEVEDKEEAVFTVVPGPGYEVGDKDSVKIKFGDDDEDDD
jgi:hypothetical protein